MKKSIVAKVNAAKSAAKKKAEETKWQSLALFEAGKDAALKQFKEHEQEIKKANEQVQEIKTQAGPALRRAQRFAPPSAVPETPPELPAQPLEALHAFFEKIEDLRQPVEKLLLPKLLAPAVFVWPFLLLAGGLAFALHTSMGWGIGAGAGVVVALAVAAGAFFGLAGVARKQVAPVYPPLQNALAEAERLIEAAPAWAKSALDWEKQHVEEQRQKASDNADAKCAQSLAELDRRRDVALAEADATFPPKIQAVADRRAAALKEANELYPAQAARDSRPLPTRNHRHRRRLQDDHRHHRTSLQRSLAVTHQPLARGPRRRRGRCRRGSRSRRSPVH